MKCVKNSYYIIYSMYCYDTVSLFSGVQVPLETIWALVICVDMAIVLSRPVMVFDGRFLDFSVSVDFMRMLVGEWFGSPKIHFYQGTIVLYRPYNTWVFMGYNHNPQESQGWTQFSTFELAMIWSGHLWVVRVTFVFTHHSQKGQVENCQVDHLGIFAEGSGNYYHLLNSFFFNTLLEANSPHLKIEKEDFSF